MSDLDDKHVVITGGTGGLGPAVVAALLERGATVHIPCVEPTVPPGFALAGHPRVHLSFAVDLAAEQAVVSYYAALPSLWASVHLAGGFAAATILDTGLGMFADMFSRNAVTCFLCCREAVRTMRRSAAGSGGRIVNVAARPALEPTGDIIAYAMSKAAVASITRCLAAELKDEGIWVNAVVPSIIDTPANRAAMPDGDFARWPKPAEIGEAVAFFVTSQNALTSGSLLPVYGRA